MAVNNVTTYQQTIQEIIDSTAAKANERNTSGVLGKDDFLNLLITQLRYQDPLQPTDDKEFIGQMAQFSALEQMQNISSTLTHSQAFGLIGKYVNATVVDPVTKETSYIEGDVSSVRVSGGKTYVVVNGKDVPVERISDVAPAARTSSSNLSNYTNLIGFNVEGFVYDGKTSQFVGVNGMVKSVVSGLYEDYAVMDGVTAEVSAITTGTRMTDIDSIRSYLEEHDPNLGSTDNTVSLVVIDKATGNQVTVTAKLKDYTVENGTVKVTLDQLQVPLESIVSIKP